MNLHLRNTRRGWIQFLAADDGAKPATGAAKEEPAVDAAAATAAAEGEIDFKAELLKLLGLDDTADKAAIAAKIAECAASMARVPELETTAATAGDAATKLAEANAELERVRAEYQVLFERDQAAGKAKQEAEVDAIMEQFADRLTDEKAKARIRSILVSDREAGMEILNGLPAVSQPSTTDSQPAGKGTPPSPQHDPNAEAAAASETEKAAKISARAKELVAKSNPKISLTKAYQLAEDELSKPAT